MFIGKFIKPLKLEGTGDAPPAGGGTPDTPPAEGGEFKFPENWTDYLPDDLKDESSLGVIKDIPSLAKSYVHAQKAIGAGKVVLPTKHSTDADWKNFFTQVGVPEKLDDYLTDIPKEKSESDFFKQFKEMAHGAGLLPQQSKKLLEWYDKLVDSSTKELAEKHQSRMADAEAALKKEWGAAFEDKKNLAVNLIKDVTEKMGDASLAEALSESGFGNDPRFIKAMATIGEMLGEDTISGGGTRTGAITPAEIQEKIKAIQGDLNGPYYDPKHPNHKAAVDEVYKYYQMLNPKN